MRPNSTAQVPSSATGAVYTLAAAWPARRIESVTIVPAGAVPRTSGVAVATRAGEVIAGTAGGVRSMRSDCTVAARSLEPTTMAARIARVPAARSVGTVNDQTPSRETTVSPTTVPSIVIRTVCRAGAVPEIVGRSSPVTAGEVMRGAELSNRMACAADGAEVLPARSRAVAESVNGPPGTGTAAPRTGGMLVMSMAQRPSASAVTA